jgi:lipoate-protein ligase A
MTKDNAWRFICHPPLPPAMNMAIDEAMALVFPKDQIPTVRLYGWASPTLTLGAFQKIEPKWSPYLEENNITLIRRITGGRALLHDNDLTYSIVASTDNPLFAGGIKKTFFSVADGLLSGLNQLNVYAELFEPRQKSPSLREQSPFCVQSFSWYEIAASGKKLIGSAQKRWRTHFLQHGSLPLLQSSFEGLLPSKGAITLSDLLLNLPTRSQIEEAMKTGFETAWGITLLHGSLTPEETQLADQLVFEKYQTPSWNKKC